MYVLVGFFLQVSLLSPLKGLFLIQVFNDLIHCKFLQKIQVQKVVLTHLMGQQPMAWGWE